MSGSTVVLADDNRVLREAFVYHLQPTYDVRDVGTGEDLLEALDPAVDAVVCDWRLEGLQKTALLAEIDKTPVDPAVVVISGCLPARDWQAHGVDETREKPLSGDALRTVIGSALAKSSNRAPERHEQPAQ